MYRDGKLQLRFGTSVSRMRGDFKRVPLLFALLAIVLSSVALPSTSLAFTDGDPAVWAFVPDDGVGDSPIMP